jgi:hypothetical protein
LLDEAAPTMSAIGAGTMGYYRHCARYLPPARHRQGRQDDRAWTWRVCSAPDPQPGAATPSAACFDALVVPQGGVPGAQEQLRAPAWWRRRAPTRPSRRRWAAHPSTSTCARRR